FLGALLLLWEWAARAGHLNPMLVPPPSRVLEVAWSLVRSGEILEQILSSLKRAGAGYALAAAVCIPLGLAMGLLPRLHRAFEVVVEMLRPIPPPVIIPVAMLFFGLDDAMKIFVIFFSCAWPILLNTVDGA